LISTKAVTAAPAGLYLRIPTAVGFSGAAIHHATAVAAAKSLAMTTTQKTLAIAVLAIGTGTGVYEANRISELQAQLRTEQERRVSLDDQVERLLEERDAVHRENARLNRDLAEVPRLRAELAELKLVGAREPAEAAAKSWADRVSQLKQHLQHKPEAGIPEIELISESDWLNAAKDNLDTENDFRRALSRIRFAAESKVAGMMQKALSLYLERSNGEHPTDLMQLRPFLQLPLADAILERWTIASAADMKDVGMGEDKIITQKAVVDELLDSRFGIGPHGFASAERYKPNGTVLNPVQQAYRATHENRTPNDPSELLPYANTPEQIAEIQKLVLRASATHP
jgi:hypothetical protein